MSKQRRSTTYTVITGQQYFRTTEPLSDEDLAAVVDYMKELKQLSEIVLEPQGNSGHVIINPAHLVSIEFF